MKETQVQTRKFFSSKAKEEFERYLEEVLLSGMLVRVLPQIEFFENIAQRSVYSLSPLSECLALSEQFSGVFNVPDIECLPWSQAQPKAEEYVSSVVSLRYVLMERSLIRRENLFCFPQQSLSPHFPAEIFGKLYFHLQEVFDVDVFDCSGDEVCYWIDALEIFSVYLNMAVSISQIVEGNLFKGRSENERFEEVIKQRQTLNGCERVIKEVLPFCVPMGYKIDDCCRKLVVVCAD